MSGSVKPAGFWNSLKRTARRKTAGVSVPLAAARSSIMHRCDICGTLFDKPTLVSYSEIIDWDGNREEQGERRFARSAAPENSISRRFWRGMTMIHKIPASGMSREGWLLERKNSLGGSDMGAVLG